MPDHRASQIIDALITNIGVNTSAGVNVFRSVARPIPDGMAHAIEVSIGPDEELEIIGGNFIDSYLTVYVDLRAKTAQPLNRTSASTPNYEENQLALRKETHIRIMADTTQGLAFVIDTIPAGAARPEYDGEGDQVDSVMRTTWRIKYRSSLKDPSQ